MSTSVRATSTGHYLSDTAWLDTHFETARPEYEESLRYVGIQSGWSVLDSGCGSGGFLPLMSELVGPDGHISALDLAPENVTRVEALVHAGQLSKNIKTQVGSMLALPFPAASFDCVWSANVMQYVTGVEFSRAVAEFKRVLKPGGVLAIKEFDVTMLQFLPIDSSIIPRLITLRRAKAAQSGALGSWAGPELPRLLRREGLRIVRRRSWLVERWAPLGPHARAFAEGNFALQLRMAEEHGAPDADIQLWRDAAADPARILDDPDFCLREGFVVVVAQAAD